MAKVHLSFLPGFVIELAMGTDRICPIFQTSTVITTRRTRRVDGQIMFMRAASLERGMWNFPQTLYSHQSATIYLMQDTALPSAKPIFENQPQANKVKLL